MRKWRLSHNDLPQITQPCHRLSSAPWPDSTHRAQYWWFVTLRGTAARPVFQTAGLPVPLGAVMHSTGLPSSSWSRSLVVGNKISRNLRSLSFPYPLPCGEKRIPTSGFLVWFLWRTVRELAPGGGTDRLASAPSVSAPSFLLRNRTLPPCASQRWLLETPRGWWGAQGAVRVVLCVFSFIGILAVICPCSGLQCVLPTKGVTLTVTRT